MKAAILVSTALFAAIFATAAPAQMVIDKKVISADEARKIAEGCEAFAKAKGWHVSVWVLDETLTPLYFYRMQGTPMFTVKPAMMKAEAAVRTGQPNDAYVQNATTRGPFVATVTAIAQNYVENPTYFPPALTGDPEKLARMVKNIPAGRLARSEESARLAVYLASEDADFFIGQVVPFAGGWVTP